MARTFESVNRRVVATGASDVAAGAFDVVLPVPADVPAGRYMVRVYIQGASGSAMGGSVTRVFAKR
jgi:hypothetical protein